jgi:hypothetical protein
VKSWLKWTVLIAVSVQAFGQTVSPNLLTEFDLRAFGLQVPKKGEVSAHDMLILFLSEDRLLLLDQGQPTILDVSHGTARRAGVSDIPEWFAPDGNAGHGLLFNLRMRDYFYAGGEKSPDALSDQACEFNRSTQHLLAVYWQGSGTLKFFAVVG